MKFIVTAGIFFFLGLMELIAQSDFRNGYFVKINNDTIHGLIDYKGNKSNSTTCIYRVDINSEDQVFTPDEINAYRFLDGKYYVSKSIKSGDKEQQLFLEFLINGVIDIYYYRDYQGEHYLVGNEFDKIYELTTEGKEIFVNNTRYVKGSKAYIGQLKATFKESPTISRKVESIEVNHKSLIKITQDYHNEIFLGKEYIIYEESPPRPKRNFGLLFGLNFISITETFDLNERYYYLHNRPFGVEAFPSVGIFYKVNLPFINERLNFQYEATYSHIKLKTSKSYIEPLYDINFLNDITSTQNSFNNSALMKYEFPTGRIRPTFQVGGFLNYYFKSNYNRSLEAKFPWGETYYTEEISESPFSKFDYGISLGFGVLSKIFNRQEISIDLKYQRGIGLLHGMNSDYLLLNIGFQIGK